MTDLLGPYGSGEYGAGPYGSVYPPYGLESVTALTSTLVRVRYTALFDPAFPPLTSLINYSIFPALTVNAVIVESAQTVLLITEPQVAVLYTLTIADARGYFGQPLDPALDSQSFLGVPISPTFFAVATRKTRVRAVFTEAMLQNAALTDPTKYVLTDLSGNSVSVLTVQKEQSADVRSVVLTLGANLVDERHYRLTTLSGIVTETLKLLSPDTSVFQWVENTLRTQILLDRFSGEVQTGLYGIHGGLVFFSPALVTAAANSIIQIDDVSVCTKAYDEYHFPPTLDPKVLFTHGAGIAPTPNITTLNSTDVLWAKFPRLIEATLTLLQSLNDIVPAPVDGPCDATFRENWDLAFVSLLNSTAWKIFDNAGIPPAYFIVANNLAPIPPGSVVTIQLQPP
jgi:hypothetical protein